MRLTAVPGLVATRDHFGLSPWRPGQRKYAYHLTLALAPEVQQAAEQAHRALAGLPGLRPVPVPWLHLTMTGLGDVTGIDDQALAAVAEPVFDHWTGLGAVELHYDQLLLADESVMLTARDDAWLQQLATVQRQAADRVLGAREWRRLWPHTSLAYATAAVPADDERAALEPLADALPDELVARPTLTLLELGRDGGDYTWRVVREQPAS